MGKGWNKGYTKETHPSVKKISSTMRSKKIDNFKKWREDAKKKGLISTPKKLRQDGDLAELIGVVLGDGHIEKFPRCEALYLTFHADDTELVDHYVRLIEKIFGKRPHTAIHKSQKSARIRLYQKNISDRLQIPTGARGEYTAHVPRWILSKDKYIVRYLRGLYEAEGTIAFHEKTYTHKLIFTNYNDSLLSIVYRLLKKLRFHPHRSEHRIQISKKDEVQKLNNLLQFRSY